MKLNGSESESERDQEIENKDKKKGKDEERGKSRVTRNKLMTLSTNYIAAMGAFSFIGYQVDKYFEHKTLYGTLIGLLLGFFWSIYETFKIVKWMNDESS